MEYIAKNEQLEILVTPQFPAFSNTSFYFFSLIKVCKGIYDFNFCEVTFMMILLRLFYLMPHKCQWNVYF